MKTRLSAFLLCAAAASLFSACGSTPNTGSMDDRELLQTRSNSALADFKNADPSLQDLLDRSHAYAIFPQVISAAVGVGGAHGNGEVFQHGQLIGYADMSQGSIGVQLGGQKQAELIVFENPASLSDLQHSTFEFDARATAVAASKGAGAAANYSHGVIVFVLPESGLMAQAAIGGQKFRYTPAQ